MAKRLKTYVHVLGDDGENRVFGPEDDVPAEYAKKIGDHAWVDADEPLPDNRPGVVVENPGDEPKRSAAKKTEEPAKAAARSRRAPAKKAAAGKAAADGQGAEVGGAGDGGSGSSSGD